MSPTSENTIHNNTGSPEGATNKFIVKYRRNYYDLTEFVKKHPGGINTLKGLNNGDMTARFLKAPPHSDAAMYLMKEYQVQGPKLTNRMNNESNEETTIDSRENTNEPDGNDPLSEDQNNNDVMDEDMEHLVDWSDAMIPQISKITKHYNDWVHKPVDRPLRLFGPWYLEICTKTPWWVVPSFWMPVITKCLCDDIKPIWRTSDSKQITLLFMYFTLGVLFWTLLEYMLHRFVFHMHVGAHTNRWICTLHFLIHGLHHKVPFDPLRLVFPPVPGVIIATAIYTPLSFFIPQPRTFLSGGLFGYLCYDMIHYYLHYGNPSLQHLYYMKRYHYQHHFAHQDLGYGISSPLWDFIFNTRIHLRKLRFRLRWK